MKKKKKVNRRDAEYVMGMVGSLTILGLADMEDFLEVMIALEGNIDTISEDSIDYIIQLLSVT